MKVYATNNTPAAGKQKGVFCVAAALTVLTGAFAVDLEVTAPTTISSDGDYDNAIVRADLTIASGAKVTATGKGTKVDATVTLTGGAKFATSLPSKTQYSFAEIGSNGGAGGFVAEAGGSYTIQDAGLALWIEMLSLSAAATTDAEYFDVITLGNGTYADITCFTNNNDKAARYVFDGGTLRKSYFHSRGYTAVAPAGKTVVFEGINGNHIAYTPVYLRENYFFGGDGTFRTQGNCDFILSGIGERDAVPAPNCTTRDQDTTAGATNNPNRAWMRITSNGNLEWNHAGSFRLQGNAWLRLAADNRLPSGENTGGISIEGSGIYRPRLDLNGYSSTINGLVANAQSEVTNFASAVTSTLTFGAFKDGVLQADIRGNIDVVKSNATTTLTVRDTSLPGKFSIAEGTVRVEAGSTGVSSLGELTLESGATLAIDGAVVNCTSFQNNGGTVSCSNGGRLVYVPAAGTTYHLDAVNAFDIGGVHVQQGGTLVFSGDRCTNEWYRFRFRAAETGTDRLEVGRIALSSATNNIVGGRNYMYGSTFLACRLASCDEPVIDQVGSGWTNYVYQAATATAPKDLPRGKALLKPGVKFMCQKDSLSKQMFDTLFDCKTGWDSSLSTATEFMAVGLSLNEQNSGTWVDVTFRLAEGKAMARSYSLFATTWATRMARSWVVQSSPDGVEWEDMDERSFTSAKAEYFSGISYNWYAYPHGYRFTSGHLTGAKGFSSGAVVQVDAGGVLDCSMVDGGQTVSALVVDVAIGCGTFKGVSFAQAGTIEVSNWNKAALYSGVPFSIDGTTGAENLANWSVLVDGSVTSRALFYSDGRLYLKRRGTMVIVL